MSEWRRVALEYLPECKELIDDSSIGSPMMLWIEFDLYLDDLTQEAKLPVDTLRRLWEYCLWCLDSRNQDLQQAAVCAFCEHLIDNNRKLNALPKFINGSEFRRVVDSLYYHNTEDRVENALKLFPKHDHLHFKR